MAQVKLGTKLSKELDKKLAKLQDIVLQGKNLKEEFSPEEINQFKSDYHNHSIIYKEFMYQMIYLLNNVMLHDDKGTPKFKKPLNHTFNIEYVVRDAKAGINIPKTLSLNMKDKIKIPNLVEKYPELHGLEHTVENLMKKTTDSDFTLSLIPEISDNRYTNLRILRSYALIKPEWTGKFKRSKAYNDLRHILWMEYRVKSSNSLVEKLFDNIYQLDENFATPLAYQDWSQYKMKKHRKKVDSFIKKQQKEGFKKFRQRSEEEKSIYEINDINAIRIVTPELAYMDQLTKYIVQKLKIPKNKQRIYLDSLGTMKGNDYESIHIKTPDGEIQLRDIAMHHKVENDDADHDIMKQLCARRRWHFMELNPEAKKVYAYLRQMFADPRDRYC